MKAIEELRGSLARHNGPHEADGDESTLNEAIDELEGLREENESLKGFGSAYDWCETARKANEEIERLRAVLEKYANTKLWGGGSMSRRWTGEGEHGFTLARDALKDDHSSQKP